MNPRLNKKVKKDLDAYFKGFSGSDPEVHHGVKHILIGALRDANFHSEAKKVDSMFPKAKQSKYYGKSDWEDSIEQNHGVPIAKAAKWDGHDIIDAISFFVSMFIGGPLGKKLMSLKESIEESLVEEGEKLDEKNVPTNPSKWSYYKAQAKKKFDVYPSAYANGWAAKQYKKAGGGWKTESVNEDDFMMKKSIAKKYGDTSTKTPEGKLLNKAKSYKDFTKWISKYKKYIGKTYLKDILRDLKDLKDLEADYERADDAGNSYNEKEELNYARQELYTAIRLSMGYKESVNEGMVSPSRGHAYYKLSKDTPIKYVSGHYGVGLKVPGVLLHNEYDTIKGQKGAYIINYFNQHFYVDIKNKFASRIAHPDNKEQNKDLKKNMQFSAVAPDHKDWKRFVKESVNEGYGKFIKAKNLTDIIKLSKQKKNATFYVTDDNNSRIGAFYLKNGKFAKATTANPSYDLQNNKTKLRDRSDVIYKYKVDESVNEAKDKVFVVMFKVKKDLSNRSVKPSSAVYAKEADAKKFLKSVEKDGGKGMIVKSNKPVGVKVNEAASRTAMEIGGLTGMNKDAIQKFVDDNKLDIEKVYQFVKKGKLADRMKLVSAIAGKPNNPVQKKMVKQFGEGIIKEAKVRLGKDSVNFKVMGDSKGLTLIAASGNDLDGLQGAVENDVDVKEELRKTLEKQLKVPVEVDRDYDGAGFRFNIDFYSLAKKVK